MSTVADFLLLALLFLPKILNHVFTELLYRIRYVKVICTLSIFIFVGILVYKMLFPAPNIVVGIIFFLLFVSVASILSQLSGCAVEAVIEFVLLILDFPSGMFDDILYRIETTEKDNRDNLILRGLRKNKDAEAGLRYFIEKDKKTQKYYVNIRGEKPEPENRRKKILHFKKHIRNHSGH